MPSFTPQHAAIVEPLRVAGAPKQAMLRALADSGFPVNYRTLRKYLEASPRHASGRAGPAPRETAAEPPLAPDDDLGRLARRRDQVDQALDAWQDQLPVSGAGVRAYRALSAELTTLTRALVELRPRPEAEQERLAALGASARVELLERARAAASPDDVSALRLRVADLERVNGVLRKALAE